MIDPIPPGHGEPEPQNFGRGSNTYTDEDWDLLAAWIREVRQYQYTARDEEEIEF
jgi:hypothetical protein